MSRKIIQQTLINIVNSFYTEYMRHYLTLLSAALVVLTTMAAPRNNILTLKQSITDNDIVYPESFETDTREMMKNWYLQNYTVLDADVENKASGEVSDEEYIKRLSAIPSVIELPYNQIVRSYIDRYVKRNRTLVEEMLGMSLYYMPIFEQALEKEGLPLELKYLPVIESALNPNAVSRAGAAGLWQFMVGTGKGLGLEVNSLVDERRDPYRSSEKAATYLKDLHSIYNDWSLAIAAYNCGPANVNKALKRAGGEGKDFWDIYNYLPRETRGYVPAFIAANYVMTYFKRHNISPGLARKPLITDTVSISNRVHFSQIAHVLNMPIEEIRVLNPQYRQDVIPGNNHPYTLVLPSQQVYSYIMSEDSILAYRPDLYNHRDVVEPAGTTASTEQGNYTYENKLVTEYHKVRRGETASSIAAHYGMSPSTFTSINGLRGGKVKRGQVVKVQTRKRVRVYNKNNDNSSSTSGDDELMAQGDTNANEESSETAQIDEVKQVEKAAAESRSRGPQRVKVETPAPAHTAKAQQPSAQQDSRQWHQRNERYADNKRGHNKGRSQEENYKQSRSSSKRGDSGKRGKHAVAEKPATSSEYNIKKGESLSQIAEKTGVSVEAIRKANGISGDKIKAGDNIKIPAKSNGKSSKSSSKTTSKSSSKKSSGKATSSTKSSSKSGGTKKRKR